LIAGSRITEKLQIPPGPEGSNGSDDSGCLVYPAIIFHNAFYLKAVLLEAHRQGSLLVFSSNLTALFQPVRDMQNHR